MSTINDVPGKEDEREPRFGENFAPDDTNRLDVLHQGEPLPEPINVAREVRSQLKATVDEKSPKNQGWPECPSDVHSVDDLFTRARDTVTARWSSSAKNTIDQKAAQWLAEIPDNEKNAEIRKKLSPEGKLEERLGMQDISDFEEIRPINPEAWRTLVLASSERQLAAIELSRRWVKELPEGTLDRIGASRTELQLFLDIASLTGKFFDQAYVKQIELADAPGGSTKSKLGLRAGAEYIYDIQPDPASNKFEKKPFKDVFKFEFSKLVRHFEELAKRAEALLADGKLPETYRNFPAYLRQMAQVYGSSSVSPKQLDVMWRNLLASVVRLAKEGCPIMLVPQSCPMVAGDAEKVDIEMRLGFQTPGEDELRGIIDKYTPIGQEMLDEHRAALSEPYQFPPVIVNIQPFAFGSNLQFYTEGQSEKESVMLHVNVSADAAAKTRLPLLRKLSNNADDIDEETFKKFAAIDTAFHEMGHAVLPVGDVNITNRVGPGNDSSILEELKAETAGIGLLLRGFSQDDMRDAKTKKYLKNQFLVKLATVAQYVSVNSSEKGSMGERYYFASVGVIKALFDAGVLIYRGGKYDITDVESGFRAISDAGADIVNRFYTNTTDEPSKVRGSVKTFITDLKRQEKDPNVAEFIKRARA